MTAVDRARREHRPVGCTGGFAGWVGLALVVAPWGFVIANASSPG